MLQHLRAAAGRWRNVHEALAFAWLLIYAQRVHAQGSDMPVTLPDDDSKPDHDSGTTRLLDEEAERAHSDGSPTPVQEDEPAGPPGIRFEASINATLSAPIGNNPDVAGFGYAVTYGAGWGEIPLALGVDFISVGSIGDATSQVEVELQEQTQRVERAVNTRLMHFDAWVRLQPAHYWVRPYVEGFFGAQLFQGRYLLRFSNQQSDLAQADDWGRNFGWGLGAEFVDLLGSTGMSLTLGMRYVYGHDVRVARSIVLANERLQARYDADTSVLLFMVGIGLHYELANPPRKHQ
jgi:hypothetical protein